MNKEQIATSHKTIWQCRYTYAVSFSHVKYELKLKKKKHSTFLSSLFASGGSACSGSELCHRLHGLALGFVYTMHERGTIFFYGFLHAPVLSRFETLSARKMKTLSLTGRERTTAQRCCASCTMQRAVPATARADLPLFSDRRRRPSRESRPSEKLCHKQRAFVTPSLMKPLIESNDASCEEVGHFWK